MADSSGAGDKRAHEHRTLQRKFESADDILAAVLRTARFWRDHAGEAFNERQRTMLNRLLDGFFGKLNCSKWATLTKTSQDTAARDIDDLVKRHILLMRRVVDGARATCCS